MEYVAFFSQLFIVVFGVFAGLLFAFFIVWPKIENYLLKINAINERRDLSKDKMQLRFAAYERLLLLIHRISPQQVMIRNHNSNISIVQFKQSLIADIDTEFQHNYTQQLYVTDAAWAIIKDLKESTISLLRNASNPLPNDANVDDYIAIVLKHVKDLDVNPYDASQIILKRELLA